MPQLAASVAGLGNVSGREMPPFLPDCIATNWLRWATRPTGMAKKHRLWP